MSRYNYVPNFIFEQLPIHEGKRRSTNSKEDLFTVGYWDMEDKQLELYPMGLSSCHGNKNSYHLQRKIINTISHECIHGVVQHILEKDRFTGSLNSHWPHLHGMDDDYKRVCKRFEF